MQFIFFLLALVCIRGMATEAGAVITCDKERHELRVQYNRDVKEIEMPKSGDQRVRFWDLLKIKKCSPGHQFAGGPCEVAETRIKRSSCQIGEAEFRITLEPLPYNTADLTGECGAAVTGSITISKGKQKIVNQEFFEHPSCPMLYDENAEAITEIIIRADDNQPIIVRKKNPFL